MTRDDSRAVLANQRAHDAVGALYDDRHPEIFNEIEQARLRAAVVRAVELASSSRGSRVRALDVGSGTGNLIGHLIAAGASVTASDLSRRLLDVVEQRFGGRGLDGILHLNGRDLRPVPDASYDLVTTYSVLHHVPDYLALVREMVRVVAPGGIILIDHERTETSWTSEDYVAFRRTAVVWPERRWWYWLQPSRYWKRLRPLFQWRRWRDPRWMPEGDIHIWPDDHIEWSRVESALVDGGCEIVQREDYLLFEPRYRRDVWELWRNRCSDMQLMIAQKTGGPSVAGGEASA